MPGFQKIQPLQPRLQKLSSPLRLRFNCKNLHFRHKIILDQVILDI